ncbi:MAG: hypothetical protein ACRDMV_03585 [Streptosporangiales bacterium]
MKWMDRARTVGGLLWVGAGLAFQVGWLVFGGLTPGPVTLVLLADFALLALLVLTRPRSAAAWLTGWVTAVLLGLDLAEAVADRFGALGGPGDPGISWGSWDSFVAYTAVLLSQPPHVVAAVAAVLATVAEAVLSLLLLSGWQRRWAGKALAGLFTVYLLALAVNLGLDEVARYGMPVLIGGALLLSACPARRTEGRERGVPDHRVRAAVGVAGHD